jgi:beta-glucosidase
VGVSRQCLFSPMFREDQRKSSSPDNGADPYLAGQSAMQHVRGLQDQNVMSMARHYIGNDDETGRQYISANMDDR